MYGGPWPWSLQGFVRLACRVDQDLAEGRGDRKIASATTQLRNRLAGAGQQQHRANGLTVLLLSLLMVEELCVLRTTDDPSSHSQTNATLVRMEPQPDFMYPHQTPFWVLRRVARGAFLYHNLSARRGCASYEATMVRPSGGRSYRWAPLCI